MKYLLLTISIFLTQNVSGQSTSIFNTTTNETTNDGYYSGDALLPIKDGLTEVDVHSDHMRLSIRSQAERSLYVRLQVFLSKHIDLLSSNTNQKSNNRRSKRQLLEDIALNPNVYNGNNFAADRVQMTSTAVRLLSNHVLTNEVEFASSKESSPLIKRNNEVLTMIELPPSEQVSATISTPNYPLSYPSDSNVAFFIRTSGDYSLQLEFTDYDVETSFDSVFIIKVDRDTSEKTLVALPTKNDNLVVYNSDGKDFLIILKTDCTGESRGFSGIVTVVTQEESAVSTTVDPLPDLPSFERFPETKECGELKLEGNGIIRSPEWPDYYPADTVCTYLLTSKTDKNFDLDIEVSGIELKKNLMQDHVVIYLGDSDKSPILAILNGYNQSHHFVTNTSQVFIKFKSYPDSFFNNGFSIKFKETNDAPLNLPTCGGTVKQNSRIYLPNYATYKSILCEWRLQANVNEKAKAIVYINSLPCYASGTGNGVQIYNGPNTSSKNIGILSRTHFNNNFTYVSDSEYLYVRYLVSSFYEDDNYYAESSSSFFDFSEN